MNDDLLARLLTETDEGAGRLLLLHGGRGVGKSWWADRAAAQARAAGFVVHRAAGRSQSASAVVERLLAEPTQRPCIVIDDVDFVDAELRRDIRNAVETVGAVAVVSAASASAFDGALAVRVEPLSNRDVVSLLRSRGLAAQAAQRCAVVAAGNPGLALSLADGLSDEQRADHAAVPEMPRLAADIADDLHSRLRQLGERTCRALVVAAASEDGDLVAIRAALRELGEAATPATSSRSDESLESLFDGAEEAAIVDVVGATVRFVDPWLRLAAYYLVAPASRRAAHRALAAAYSSPRQGRARVRQLVAASSGPSDEVSSALTVVAASVARRGDRAEAARMASEAAGLAVSNELRSSCLLRAIGWWLDEGDYTEAQRLTTLLDGSVGDEQLATIEASALLHGDREDSLHDPARTGSMSERQLATWEGRRQRRLEWWADAEAGLHARLIQHIGGTTAAPAELWARGQALRDAGFVRDAAELTGRVLATLPAGSSHVRDRWELLAVDLAVLSGRDDAVIMPANAVASPLGRSIVARAALASSAATHRDAASIHVPDRDPLRSTRAALLRGLAAADHRLLAAEAVAAEGHGLPIEAGDAWLMAAEVASAQQVDNVSEVVAGYVQRAFELFHRCAVRGWDDRLRSLLAATQAQSSAVPTVAADPALDALSAAEWRVAGSVAEGLTNREVAAALFLSVKTVDFHLQQIYRKLALRSRTELAVRVAGHANSPARRTSPASGEVRR